MTPIISMRQALQSLGQFAVIFITGIAVYRYSELSWDVVWQPLLQGVLGALGVLGVSRLGGGGSKQGQVR